MSLAEAACGVLLLCCQVANSKREMKRMHLFMYQLIDSEGKYVKFIFMLEKESLRRQQKIKCRLLWK